MPASTDAHTHGHGLVSKVRGYLAGGTAHRWERVRRDGKGHQWGDLPRDGRQTRHGCLSQEAWMMHSLRCSLIMCGPWKNCWRQQLRFRTLPYPGGVANGTPAPAPRQPHAG